MTDDLDSWRKARRFRLTGETEPAATPEPGTPMATSGARKLVLDDIERSAREWAAEDADWYPNVGPKTTLALIARIRGLTAFIAATPDDCLRADKLHREDFPELFTDEDGAALYMDEAKRRVLTRGVVIP